MLCRRLRRLDCFVVGFPQFALWATNIPPSPTVFLISIEHIVLALCRKSGKKKSQGYPDIEFTAEGNAVYLEVKSYGEGKGGGSMRSFYFSPSDDFKVSKNALHLLIAFEITRKSDASFVTGWKIITVDNLLVDVKYEFNSNNPRLYTEHSVLAEKKIILDL